MMLICTFDLYFQVRGNPFLLKIFVVNNFHVQNSCGFNNLYFSWNFEELDNCGWTWTSSSSDLTISSALEIIGEPHRLVLGGVTIEVATKVDPIPLRFEKLYVIS